jgi:hypothetical protein
MRTRFQVLVGERAQPSITGLERRSGSPPSRGGDPTASRRQTATSPAVSTCCSYDAPERARHHADPRAPRTGEQTRAGAAGRGTPPEPLPNVTRHVYPARTSRARRPRSPSHTAEHESRQREARRQTGPAALPRKAAAHGPCRRSTPLGPSRMDTSSEGLATALHKCRSGRSADRAMAGACSSFTRSPSAAPPWRPLTAGRRREFAWARALACCRGRAEEVERHAGDKEVWRDS